MRVLKSEDIWPFVRPADQQIAIDRSHVVDAVLMLMGHETLELGSGYQAGFRTEHKAIKELLWYATKTSVRYARRHFGMRADLHAQIRRLELVEDFVSIRKIQIWKSDFINACKAWKATINGDIALFCLLRLLPREGYDEAQQSASTSILETKAGDSNEE